MKAVSVSTSLAYVLLYRIPVSVVLLPAPDPAGSTLWIALAALIVWRPCRMSVTTAEDGIIVRNFWRAHHIRRDAVAAVERREFWPSPLAVFPNSDVPTVVANNGRVTFVVVGAGGNRRADAVIKTLGVDVPADGRMTLAEGFSRLRGIRRRPRH